MIPFHGIKTKNLIALELTLAVFSCIIIFTNVSLIGTALDFTLITVTLFILYLIGFKLNTDKSKFGKLILSIGKGSLTIPVLLLLGFIFNPLLLTFSLDYGRLTPIAVNVIDNYRIEHYSVNLNFMGSKHLVKIKKLIIPNVIEQTIGEVKLGIYNASNLPASTISISRFDDGKWKHEYLESVIYEIQIDSLYVKTYKDSSYVTSKYNY